MQNEILFSLLAMIALISAVVMITVRRPIDAALSFIVTLVSMAGLFALLGGSFLFLVQMIIYAGAVMALILFIIMYLNLKDDNLPPEPHKTAWMSTTAAITLPFALLLARLVDMHTPRVAVSTVQEGFGTIRTVGLDLFAEWVLPFELISILLLVALVGALTLAKKEPDA